MRAASAGSSIGGLVRLRFRKDPSSRFGWADTRQDWEVAAKAEHRVERLVGRGQPAAESWRLQQRLLLVHLEMAPTSGGCSKRSKNCNGGSCNDSLFEALSSCFWGTAGYHLALRQIAVDYMATNPEEYQGFVGDNWLPYLAALSIPGVPGDELALRAIADHFGCSINIATPDAFMWLLRYAPKRTRTAREAFVAFTGPNYWAPVHKQTALTTLKLAVGAGAEAKGLRRALRERRMALAAEQQQQQQGLA